MMQEKNSLADFVDANNLNRRRAQFQSITLERDNYVEDFPQMGYNDLVLIPLGVYQIKQARSYYGEHVRQDGSYIIEVCKGDRHGVTTRIASNRFRKDMASSRQNT